LFPYTTLFRSERQGSSGTEKETGRATRSSNARATPDLLEQNRGVGPLRPTAHARSAARRWLCAAPARCALLIDCRPYEEPGVTPEGFSRGLAADGAGAFVSKR